MSLLEEHKAERRGRILAAARELIAERGYDGLTMRDLAQASRVSVPTLYNLFGGKQAILLGELEETFERVVASTRNAPGGSAVERAFAGCASCKTRPRPLAPGAPASGGESWTGRSPSTASTSLHRHPADACRRQPSRRPPSSRRSSAGSSRAAGCTSPTCPSSASQATS